MQGVYLRYIFTQIFNKLRTQGPKKNDPTTATLPEIVRAKLHRASAPIQCPPTAVPIESKDDSMNTEGSTTDVLTELSRDCYQNITLYDPLNWVKPTLLSSIIRLAGWNKPQNQEVKSNKYRI